MAAGNWIKYDAADVKMKDGTVDFDTDALRCVLLSASYTPSQAHTAYSSLSAAEVSGTGYSTHGVAIAGAALSNPSSQVVREDCNDIQFATVTLTAKYAAIVHDANGDNALAAGDIPLMYCELEAGGTVSPSAANLDITIAAAGLYNTTLATS